MLSVNHLERELEFNGLGVPEEQSLTPNYVIGSKTRKNGKRKERCSHTQTPTCRNAKTAKKSITKQKNRCRTPIQKMIPLRKSNWWSTKVNKDITQALLQPKRQDTIEPSKKEGHVSNLEN